MLRASILLSSLFLVLGAGCAAEGVGGPTDDGDPRGVAGGKADVVLHGTCSDGDALYCGGRSTGNCYCDGLCAGLHDCCEDAASACGVATNRLPDRTEGLTALLGPEALEVVAELPYPPGNVTVSEEGRIFFTFHPEGNKGDIALAELISGQAVAWPDEAFQEDADTLLSIRIDREGRLWTLDYGHAGLHAARLTAIDLDTAEIVRTVRFPREIVGLGSMLNDFRISPDGRTVYITDQSVLAGDQALVVVDLSYDPPIIRRRLENHESVDGGTADVVVDGRVVKARGLVYPSYGVDGIVLDAAGQWLYYSSLNTGELYRVQTDHLRFEVSEMVDEVLAAQLDHVATTTMSDGMAIDAAGYVYQTDMEHSAITRVAPDGRTELLIEDERLRWPDGFSWHPDGSLLVTASALHHILPEVIRTDEDIEEHAPYHIFSFRPQLACAVDEDCTGIAGE